MTRAAILFSFMVPVLGTILSPPPGLADRIHLKNGRVLEGRVLGTSDGDLVLEMGIGRIAMPVDSVGRIVPGDSPIDHFDSRAAQLDPEDAAGWQSLASWARQNDLETRARQAYEMVVQIDPDNEEAQRALGRVHLEDRWMTPDERNRALGLVKVTGTWMTPEQFQALQATGRERIRSQENTAAMMMMAAALAAQNSQPEYPTYYPVWGAPVYAHPPIARPRAVPYRHGAQVNAGGGPSLRPLTGPRHNTGTVLRAPASRAGVSSIR